MKHAAIKNYVRLIFDNGGVRKMNIKLHIYSKVYIKLYIYSMIPFQMHTQEKRLDGNSKMVTLVFS